MRNWRAELEEAQVRIDKKWSDEGSMTQSPAK